MDGPDMEKTTSVTSPLAHLSYFGANWAKMVDLSLGTPGKDSVVRTPSLVYPGNYFSVGRPQNKKWAWYTFSINKNKNARPWTTTIVDSVSDKTTSGTCLLVLHLFFLFTMPSKKCFVLLSKELLNLQVCVERLKYLSSYSSVLVTFIHVDTAGVFCLHGVDMRAAQNLCGWR